MSTSIGPPNKVPLSSDNNNGVSEANSIINAFMPWLLILAGSVCNVLIILGMRSKSFLSLSTSVYIVVGAVNDLTSLIICLVPHWLYLNFPETIMRESALCKFYNFYGWGQADFGIMLTSVMTADRAFAILHPMTRVDLIKTAKIIIVICVIVVVLKEFHFLFTSVLVDVDRKDRMCDVNYNNSDSRDFYVNYWPWIDTTFVTLFFICIVISNTILILHVRRSRKRRQLNINENKLSPNVHKDVSSMSIHGKNYETVAYQVTRMLIAESLTFILLSYPFSVYLIVVSHIEVTEQLNALVFNIVFYLLYANKCVNFTVYCLAGQRFRKVIIKDIFSCLKCTRNAISTAKEQCALIGFPRTHRVRSEIDKNHPSNCSTMPTDIEI